MPKGKFGNIIWDVAIEHFREEEIETLLCDIKERLDEKGIFSGQTIVERSDGSKQHHLHEYEYEFKSKEDLFRFLEPHFEHVIVFETVYPERHNLYFWASDGILPFSEGWPNIIAK